MTISIAHLAPPGTYAEQAAMIYRNCLTQVTDEQALLCPHSTIPQTLRAVSEGETSLAVVPVENSIEGSVSVTFDTLWQLDNLRIQLALVMPITHTLISCASNLETIQTVYSHPQALAQCQKWLENFLPQAQQIPTNSTTEALKLLRDDITAAVISSQRAAQLNYLPILTTGINDYPGNCTRFWVVSQNHQPNAYKALRNSPSHTSIAFTVPANVPGALVKPLQVFAHLGINLSKIESRPTKRSLGEYLFFIDLEADAASPLMNSALTELANYTEVMKLFGSYDVMPITNISI
ncbi:Prephenate dehydratase [Richelia intracellularis]|nr:Prephenate dehydratase [Richelia intracellularis]